MLESIQIGAWMLSAKTATNTVLTRKVLCYCIINIVKLVYSGVYYLSVAFLNAYCESGVLNFCS